MIFKNSLKLNIKNMEKVWQYFFFRVIIWCITLILIIPVITRFKDVLSSNVSLYDFWKSIGEGFLYTKNFGLTLSNIMNFALAVISDSFKLNAFLVIYFFVVIFFIKPFLMNIGKYTLDETMYYYMSSHTRCDFLNVMIMDLRKAMQYSLYKTVFCLPIKFINLMLCYFVLSVDSVTFSYFKTIIILVIFCFIYAVEQTLVSGWASAIIVFGCNAFVGFVKGFKTSLKMINRIFLNYFMLTFIVAVLTFAFSFYSLIILKPIFVFNIAIFEMVSFFTVQGMRFYISKNNYISPKKLEEIDKFKKSKYLL